MTTMREKLLEKAKGFSPVLVTIPEIDFPVYVRPLSLSGMRKYLELKNESPEIAADKGTMVILLDCLCDESGVRQFTQDDAAALGDLPSSVCATLVEKVMSISAVQQKDAEDISGK